MANNNAVIIGKPYSPKTPYIDGFDAACWLGKYWDLHKIGVSASECPDKYQVDSQEWIDWHSGYNDGLDEIDEFNADILRDDPPEHQFKPKVVEETEHEIGDDDE